MTSATHTWPRLGSLLNPSFTYSGGFTSWTTSGTVNQLSGASAYGGSGDSAELEGDGTIYQDLAFASASGRFLDRNRDQSLTFYGKVTAGTVTLIKVRVLLLTGASALSHYYDFFLGKWIAAGSYTVTTAPYFGIEPSDSADYTIYRLPRILAPNEASNAVTESYIIRVAFTNDSGGGASNKFTIDEAILAPHTHARQPLNFARFMVCYDGQNYPVKYDRLTGQVTELSLHPPYHTSNSALPTVTASNGAGSLTASSYYGFVYIFENRNNGERSGTPYGIALSSAYYTQVLAGAEDTIAHDFSAIELPNSEDARTTNNTAEITHISVFRTLGNTDQEQVLADLEAGLVYYEGTIEDGATHTSLLSDANLLKQGALSDYIADPSATAMPMFDVACIWRDRLWCSGGPEFRLGFVNMTNNSSFVEGNDVTATAPHTKWGRMVEGYTFKVAGDTDEYDVEAFLYPGDRGANDESLVLSEVYRGSTGNTKDYLLRPKHGRVFFSEEGKPYATGFSNSIMLDGDQGGKVTMLVPAGNNLVMATAQHTYAMNYGGEPLDSGGVAASIRRNLGCIGSMSAAECNGLAFWLSDQGVVRCDGQRVDVVSHAVRRIFVDREDEDYILRRRSNGMAVDAYGVHYPARNQYLLAIRTRSGRQGANLILCYNYLLDTWDILRSSIGIAGWSPCEDEKGNPILLFTDPYGGVWKWDHSYVDCAGENNNHGRLTGRFISTATLSDTLLDDPGGLFIASMSNNFSSATLGLENAYIKIVSGTGVGQERRIVTNTTKIIYRDTPWDIAPDSDSVWEIGGISCVWRLKRADFGQRGNIKRLKHLMMDYDRQDLAGLVKVQTYIEDKDVSVQAENDSAGKPFTTGLNGRAQIGLDDTAGYLVRVEIDASGPENPLRVRGLGLSLTSGEKD